MAQRYDIVKIAFQANARGANAAIESLRQQCEKCNARVQALKDELKTAINANLPADQIDALRSKLNGAQKEARQFTNAYKELSKGMRTLDQGIKAFNDGTLAQMNQAFQKAVYNAAKLTRTRLDPMSDTYKRDRAELTALMDASQQNYARLQGDAQAMLKTLRDGGKVSRQALTEELNAQKELLQVLAETDKGYQRTKMNVDQLSHYLQRMGGDYDYIRQNITDTQKVSDEMLRTMYRELEQTNNEGKVTKKMLQENAKAMREIRAEQERRVQNVLGGDLSKQSEGNIRTAIANAKELMSVYGSTSKQAQTLAAQIVNAEEHLKQHGIEGERVARKEAEAVQLLADKHKMMQDRVKNLSNLSASALAETQKYWEAQRDGAERTSTAYKKAEKNLKAINAEMQRQATAQLQTDASKLGRKNLGTLSEQELQTSIAAAKQLAASMKSTDPAYKQLVDNIVRAEQHVKQFGLEGQRSTRQAAEQLQTMTDRMAKLKTLSAASLEETRRFWQAQMDGATRGSQAYKTAEQNMKQVVAEQERLTAEQNKAAASQLLKRGNLSTMSEGEIRRAIEAAKQYQQTLSTSDAAHQRLSKAIVNAEEHIKKYGIEAERSARKEAAAAAEAAKKRKETDKMMSDQLKQGTALSESALRAQQQYWQRLIDDPKTAATSLRHYQAQLERTKKLQEQMAADRIKTEGQSALAFFRGDTSNASATQIQEQAKALKAYRDSLPQKANADLIKEIDDLLLKTGASAKKSTEQLMSLRQAVTIGRQVRGGMFKGSAEELTKAKKVLEELQQRVEKGGRSWQKLQREIDGINLELKRTKTISEEVQAVLDKPTGRSFNELKQAVEQGRLKLQSMDRTTREGQKQFDELAKKIKAADAEMKAIASSAKGTASAFDKAWSRLKTYVGLYVGAAVAMQKLTATMGDLMELSDKMGEVRKTTGFTADEVGRLSENLKGLDVRTSLTSLMEISASAGQLGLKTLEDVQGFTEAANKLMIALPEMGREAATEMMRVAIATGEVDKIRKQLQEGTIEGSSATAVAMEKIASTIDRLRASSASTAPEITDFVKRVGAVGAQSGITIDQVAALGSTVSSLGLRIEMSATALSRMIPAIRNNAFELAKAIGVTPDYIRQLFDAGRGMEVILMILQRIKETNMNADDIDNMLGMAGMRDIMKDLNQQGARAGIVFAGLSQGVDELSRQLGIAKKAYEENVAIQQEFDKMNETTAARWERLKNQVEEAFVGDSAQRFLGDIIDMLRGIVDVLVGNNGLSIAMKTILTYWAALKIGIGEALLVKLPKALVLLMTTSTGLFTTVITGLKALTWQMGVHTMSLARARVAWRQLDATMKSNAIGAVVAALGYLVYKLYDMHQAAKEAAAEVGRFNQKIADERKALNDLFEPLNKSNLAQEERLKLINSINSQYGKYLGYMLSETASAQQLAEAHALIAKRIREEAYERRIAEQTRKVQDEHSDELNESYAKITERVRGSVRNGVDPQEVADILKGIVDSRVADIKYANDNRENFFTARTTYTLDPKIKAAIDGGIERLIVDGKLSRDNVSMIQKAVYRYTVDAKSQHDEIMKATANVRSDLRGIQGAIKTDLTNNLRGLVNNIANLAKQPASPAGTPGGQGPLRPQQQSFSFPWQTGTQGGAGGFGLFSFGGSSQQQQITAPLPGQRPKVNEKNLDEVRQYVEGQDNLRSYLKEYAQSISESDRQAAEAWLDSENEVNRLRKLLPSANGGGGGGGGRSTVWGTSEPGESTNWKEMTAEQLVNRREQMNKFVNSLQTDTDVKAVLNEDKALKKAIEAGMSSDMRTVIEWYNTERLKIQDELHARHLTNTGDWLDPKKQRAARKQWHDEIDAYLHELDAYYTERKTRIEQARNDEEITEGEAWRRIIQNDNEWQTRRGELQKIYADKSGEVTQEEMDAIYRIISERTGDSVEFVRGMVAKTNKFAKDIAKASEQGAATAHKWWSGMDVDAERSFLKAAQAIGKQMKFIEDTLAKERPYDGITKNLQDNLDKMGVLAAKYRRENDELARQGKEPKYSNEQITAQSYDEMAFYLRQAADAYSIDIDELLRRMVKEGMTATAEEISKSDMLKQAVMGQLRKTYQEVQDAIKKEASQIKKDVEIIWNDDARGIGGMSMKATFDKALAQLGMQQDSVSRANSLIGAGAASDNVASRLAMKQIEVQMRMQKAQYDMYRVQANQRMAALKAEAKEHQRIAELEKQAGHEAAAAEQRTKAMVALRDAENVRLSLGLTLAEETKKEEQQKAELLKIQEESQNRLYTSLREWADLLTSSLQGVMEASHAGDAEYYNELAKLDLTGKGGPGAGTYVVIDDAGTSDAKAHYEYLDERQALERQHEIEIQNAQAEAWRKLMDDLNMKMSEQITDWLNAAAQNASVDANTDATLANTEAIVGLTAAMGGKVDTSLASGLGYEPSGNEPNPTIERIGYEAEQQVTQTSTTESAPSVFLDPNNVGLPWEQQAEAAELSAERQVGAIDKVKVALDDQFHKQEKGSKESSQKMTSSTQSAFAKMTAAANLYGIAYQAMSNDNLSAAQKFSMMAIQAAGQSAITALTVDFSKTTADAAINSASVLGKLWSQLGWGAVPVFAIFTGLLGGLMGLAASKIAKSKSEIAQATGASVGAGRLATGMLTYAEGNVNELTDPASLTPGRQYNVDGADGKTYRARYMGKGAKTHITNGPEFHLVGEAGREAIIDAKTTRLLQMNETGIWRDIQTLYNGGSISGMSSRRRRGGVRAYAEGNVGEFEDMDGDAIAANGTGGGMSIEMLASLQASIDRQSDLLENALVNGIKAVNKWTGSDGIPAMYNKMQKEAQRHGEKYL